MDKSELIQLQGEYRIILMQAGLSEELAGKLAGKLIQKIIDRQNKNSRIL